MASNEPLAAGGCAAAAAVVIPATKNVKLESVKTADLEASWSSQNSMSDFRPSYEYEKTTIDIVCKDLEVWMKFHHENDEEYT